MLGMSIVDKHPDKMSPLGISLVANDGITTSGVAHRSLAENGHNDVLLKYMEDALQKHHISPDALQRHMDLITSLKIKGLPIPRSPYPQDFTTQKGNFAEVFLAEYLSSTTDAQLPIYRLRYNTNPDQSMKGDDVLLFDLDADPVRIIVGESKFRTTPDKQAVVDIVDGLVRSNKAGLPISLMFVAERLFQEGKSEIGQRVQNCALLFATNKLQIDYVGLLMSNQNAKNHINKHTDNKLHNLLMISLGMHAPQTIVTQAFEELENGL